MKRLYVVLPILCLLSCGGGEEAPPVTAAAPAEITVSVSPGSATVPAGATQQFMATLTNTTDMTVTWQVEGIEGGNSTVGTISTDGLYTAPLSPPASGAVTVTAVSQADTTKSGSATATIVFSDASLDGPYAFSFTGVDTSGFFFAAGSFEADGNGNLTSGVEDLNHRTGISQELAFTGAYSIGPDGRGSATFVFASFTVNVRFVMLSNQKALFIQFDTSSGGEGTIAKRDTAAFATSALAGGYSFGLDGISASGAISLAGRFTLDGAGAISAGVRDINDTGVVTTNEAFAGTYNVDSSGRGTATLTGGSLGPLNFSFYVVSAEEIFLVSLDSLPATAGTAEQHQQASFSTATLGGDYVLVSRGVSTSGALAIGGRFSADGLGAISDGVADGTTSEQVFDNVGFTGTYNVSSNGRGTATLSSVFGTADLALYMVSGDRVFFVLIDNFAVTSGTLLAQQGIPFATASLAGSFGFSVVGIRQAGAFALTGQLTADGAGGLDGTADVNDDGALSSDTTLSGTYTVASNGRGVGSQAGTGELRFYVVSPSRVVLGGFVNSDGAFIGTAEKQF